MARVGEHMNVRRAAPTDVEAIQRVISNATEATYGGRISDPSIVQNAGGVEFGAKLRRWLSRNDSTCHLVVEDGGIRGFVSLDWASERTHEFVPDGECHLRSLYVSPDRWGEGIGTGLLDAAIGNLPERVSRIHLAVLKENERANGFYKARAFENVGETNYTVGDANYDCWVYGRAR